MERSIESSTRSDIAGLCRLDVARAALLEAVPAEQRARRKAAETAFCAQRVDAAHNLVAVAPVHHAIQVVSPLRLAARSAIRERHADAVRKAQPKCTRKRIGNVPHHHGVGLKAEAA